MTDELSMRKRAEEFRAEHFPLTMTKQRHEMLLDAMLAFRAECVKAEREHFLNKLRKFHDDGMCFIDSAIEAIEKGDK